uniref:Transcription factor TFIIIC triple barrel domain-containing protein n=1 Tax=Ceratitis capitata TaxID=7213 RepID=W8CA46_CERCA
MNIDEESDYEEEEFLIYADFKNQLGSLELDENTAVKIIGIDSQPIAEVNGNIFKGTFDYPLGTCVFFEKDLDAAPSDPLFESSCRQKYKYFAKTNKVINFERIFVETNLDKTPCEKTIMGNNQTSEEKCDPTGDETKHHKLSENDELRIHKTYDEAIKQFPPYEGDT